MTRIDARAPVASHSRVESIAFAGALLGALVYGWLVFAIAAQADARGFGWSIYDEVFLAFMEGHLDLPARVLRLEGHFTPDGVGYVYHGLAPLITRFVLAPFVDITTTPLGPFSIWFWSTLGSAFYHAAFFKVARHVWPSNGQNANIWSALLAIAVWVGGPGLLMASNISVYHEPIAVAYALSAGIVFLWTRAVCSGQPLRRILVGLAVLAALSVHARPNVALGLYVVVLAACASALWQDRRKAVAPLLIAVTFLGIGGGSYLSYNAMRFGDSATTHGTFSAGPIQHAMTFWGYESPQSNRADAFEKYGRFNAGRILPNILFYSFEPPENLMPSAQASAERIYRGWTSDRLGQIRLEGPGAGLFFLWPMWAFFASVGLWTGRRHLMRWTGLVAGTGVSALVTFSYATVTLRYHIDVWPVMAALAIPGFGYLIPMMVVRPIRNAVPVAVFAVVSCGLVVNISTAHDYRDRFSETPGSLTAIWDKQTCDGFAERKGFTPDRVNEICRHPRAQYYDQ